MITAAFALCCWHSRRRLDWRAGSGGLCRACLIRPRAVVCESSQGLEVALGSKEAFASHHMYRPHWRGACAEIGEERTGGAVAWLAWSTSVVHSAFRRPPRLLKKRCWPSDLALQFEFGRGS